MKSESDMFRIGELVLGFNVSEIAIALSHWDDGFIS